MILRNMVVMTGLNLSKAGATLLISVLIAGAVPPHEYGLVSFAIPLMTLVMLLTDLGLSSAIVRHPALDPAQAGVTLRLMALIGAAGGALVTAAAAPTERVLAMPGLAPVLLGFAAVTACSIWATVPRALLERHLAYQRIALVEGGALLAALAGFCIALMMELGILALVAFHVLLQGIRALAFAGMAYGLTTRGGRLADIAPLVKVGGWVFLTNLLAFAARNLDRFLIGAVLGAAALGLYGLAYQFMTLPLMLIAWPASGVLLATLARMGADHQEAKAGVVCAVFTATATLSLPLMAFLSFGARLPIGTFLAHQWDGLADIVAVLAPVGAVQSLAVYAGSVLVEQGRVRLNFMLGLVNGLGVCAVFAVTVWSGLQALVLGYAVASALLSALSLVCACRSAGIGARRFAACLWPGVLATGAGVAVFGLSGGFQAQGTVAWLASTLAYLLAVAAVCVLQRGSLLASLKVLMHTRVAAP
ncbi:oligosaccharide flippase family protein [Azohydromonas caseinilytica]|uniref:Oligosaccharide flippase family protein n=1 Tax=Azohydromonas caseinilytica TaxID=2728836 RepID=A0A848FHN8_9BURK|nr:oligosaccharide flippase family protein [Azohydromonas caseinilytica]NML17773.1 oligosaccharide flippase family protein [Azohydromonas caseinilytica]